MALTDTQCRTAKKAHKPYKMSDEKGLFLLVTATGGKLWRLNVDFHAELTRGLQVKLTHGLSA